MGDKHRKEADKEPAKPAEVPPFGKTGPELAQYKAKTYEAKAIALGEVEAAIAAIRQLIAEGVEPARSQRLIDLLARQIALREQIAKEAEDGAGKAAVAPPIPVALTPEYTVRDSSETACGAVGGAAAPGHNILDYGEERTVLVKIKNTGVSGTDCEFTVNMRGGDAARTIRGTQHVAAGESMTLRRTLVATVEIVCDPAPVAAARCKSSYTISVEPKGA